MNIKLLGFALIIIAAVAGYYEFSKGYGSNAVADITSSEEELETFVLKVINENPDKIVASLESWYAEQAESDAKAQQEGVGEVSALIASEAIAPMMGNADGDVTVIEFFDYNCPYCRSSFTAIDKVMKEDKNFKVFFIEYPIFGPDSNKIAKTAIAVNSLAPEKYFDFHAVLMRQRAKISPALAKKEAIALGLDENALEEAMASEENKKALATLRGYGQKLGVEGTPAFVIGDQYIGGGMNAERLASLIAEQRDASGE